MLKGKWNVKIAQNTVRSMWNLNYALRIFIDDFNA